MRRISTFRPRKRHFQSELELLRATVLVDPVWYRESHTDLRGNSIDAARHYLEHGAREGRNPHPLFDTKWYLQHTPEASAPDINPLVHYLRRSDFRNSHPHPLFDVDLYMSKTSNFSSSQLDPLTHYLTLGWKRAVCPNNFFDPRWYLDQNPDVRATGVEPLTHYLQLGWRQDRQPNSAIDPVAYRERNRLPADAVPLLHFVLFGETRSIDDSHANGNDNRPSRPNTRPNFGSPTDLSTEPKSINLAARVGQEPVIRPPLPIATIYNGRHARDIEIVRALRALRLNDTRDNSCSSQRSLREDEIGVISAKLGLASVDGDFCPDSIGAAGREGANAQPNGRGTALDAVLGLGITPPRTVDDTCLSDYPSPIHRRYNSGRLDNYRRLSLTPCAAGTISQGPTISVLMPVYRTPIAFLERAILSVIFQTYANWELILVDDFSQRSAVKSILSLFSNADPRVKVHFCERNGGIAAATSEALSMATGTYIALVDHDDMLTHDALQKVAERLVIDDKLDLVYTDECKIDADDLVDELFHKPDWSPLLLLNFMYTGHLTVYRKALVERVGGFRSKYDFSQDYDLALRVAEQAPKVAHIDECLYGWRTIAGSAASGDRPYARTSNIAALQDAANRRGYEGVAIALPTANRIKRLPPATRPLVSVVVPSAGKLSRIKATVESIVSLTSYENYEIIFVTGSAAIQSCAPIFSSGRVHFVSYDRPFNFSEKCNVGASHAKGEYLIFFNDDVIVNSPDWIESILECLTLPGVGAVGPKLIYENGTIQHAGMITGVRRLVGTAFHTFPSQTTTYRNLAQSVREVSLICGACIAISARVFSEIHGWDACNAPRAHSDVDLCFRIRERGYSCVYTPHAELTHIGHVEIGADEAAAKNAKLFTKDKGEISVIKQWGQYLERDPYFPPKMRDLIYIDSQEDFIFQTSGTKALSSTGKDFILFSHDLSASGAPRGLYEVAKVLIDEGHYVLVISPEDGRFRQRFIDLGADVIVDPLALSGHDAIIDLAKNFDVAICNTIVCWQVPKQLISYLPVYLYVMETELIRHFRDSIPGFCEGLASATAIWALGPYSAEKIREYCGLAPLSIESGVEELPASHGDEDYPGEVVVALVGTYEPRKGQDLAVLGFKRLPLALQAMSRLVIAGRTNDHHFRSRIEQLAEDNPHIVFCNELDYLQVTKLLRRADIVLVPSRDDAGPTTAIDVLGAGRVLVISATSGVARYVVDGESGFILHDNDPEDVCATLCRVFEEKARWPEIATKARRVFESNFTRQQFKERLLRALDQETLERSSAGVSGAE
jgi:O-antigen biosynthesis protein